MNCYDFESRLEALLDGRLDSETAQICLRHARECATCSELVEAAGRPIPAVASEDLASLTSAVLERTIGSACGQARQMLPDHVDRSLAASDRGLIEIHLEGCADCHRLAATLIALRTELPKLAEAPVDRQFTTDVLAATAARQPRWRQWLQVQWTGWLQRPRFAMEAAYVSVLVIVLVLGAFSTPVAALPQKGVEWMQPEPDSPTIWTKTQDGLGTFWDSIASLFEKAEKEPESIEETP